jgi:hypothetical protein
MASLLIAAGLCPLPAFAATQATISLGDAGEALEAGSEFTVPVSISDNPGFAVATLELTYDHEALEPVGIGVEGLLATGLVYDFSRMDTVGYANSSSVANMAQDGVLFNVTFKIKDGVSPGQYAYSMRLYQDIPKNFVDKDLQTVDVAFLTGGIQVVAGQSGDDDDTGGDSGGGTGDGGTGTGGTGDGAGTGGTGTGGTGTGGTGTDATDQDPDEGSDSGTGNTGGNTGTPGTQEPTPPSGGVDNPPTQTVPDTQTPQSADNEEGLDFSSLPWGWILLIFAVVAGGLVFFLLNRRRSGEDED